MFIAHHILAYIYLFIFSISPLSEESIAQTVVDGLNLGVVLQGVGTELTAQTGLLEATEGSLVGDHVVAVDPDGTIDLLAFYSVTRADGNAYPALRALETRMAVLTFLV